MLSLWIAVIGLTLLGALTLAVLLHRSSRLVRPTPSALSTPRLNGAALACAFDPPRPGAPAEGLSAHVLSPAHGSAADGAPAFQSASGA